MTRKLVLLAVAGCGSSSAPATRTVPAPAPTPAAFTIAAPPTEMTAQPIEGAACAIRETVDDLAAPLELRVHGKRFALVRDVTELELRGAAVGATLAVVTPALVALGDVDLRRHALRPREPLQAGWLGIRQAMPGSVSDGTMTLDFKLPPNVVAAVAPLMRLPCSALTFAAAPPLPAEGAPVWLKPASKIALREAPGGRLLATIATPRIDAGAQDDLRRQLDIASLAARELARSGTHVRIRLGHANYVEGWIEAAQLGPAQTGAATFASEPPQRAPRKAARTVRCPHEVAIYVRDAGVIRVGTFKPDAPIGLGEERNGKSEVAVDLGLPPKLPIEPMGSEPDLEAYVRSTDVRACHSAGP